MRQFLRIAQGVNVLPLAMELHRAPNLWNAFSARKSYDGTPHAAVSDIWVRGRAREQISDPASLIGEYRSVFWPAWHALPALRPLVFGMMATAQAVELGSVLLTRLPPGAAILPHTDGGVGWSPEFYNAKFHLTVAGQSLSRCAGDAVTMMAGEVWTFDNLLEHSVENPGDVDRIVLIVSMRCEP